MTDTSTLTPALPAAPEKTDNWTMALLLNAADEVKSNFDDVVDWAIGIYQVDPQDQNRRLALEQCRGDLAFLDNILVAWNSGVHLTDFPNESPLLAAIRGTIGDIGPREKAAD